MHFEILHMIFKYDHVPASRERQCPTADRFRKGRAQKKRGPWAAVPGDPDRNEQEADHSCVFHRAAFGLDVSDAQDLHRPPRNNNKKI